MEDHPRVRFVWKLFSRLALVIAVVIGLFIIIEKRVPLPTLTKLLLSFPRLELFLLLCISFLISVVKAYRFYLLLSKNGIRINFIKTLRTYVASQALTSLPGGEAGRGIFLSQEVKKVKASHTTGPIVIQAYLEVFTAALVFFVTGLLYTQVLMPAIAILAFVIVLAVIVVNDTVYTFIIKGVTRIPLLRSKRENILRFHDMIVKTINKKGKVSSSNYKVIASSIISQLLGGILIFIIARHYHIELSFFKSLAIYSTAIVAQGLGGFIPGGLGITEGGMTGLLLAFGARLPSAIALILIYRITTLVFYIVVGLLWICLFYLKRLLKVKKPR